MKAMAVLTSALPVSLPVWTGLSVFCGFVVFAPAVPYWLDAPEFTAAGWTLGHAHPPGHPAMLMILKAFLLLPFGEIAFRANLFSALFGAMSAGLVCRIAQVLAADLLGRPGRVSSLGGFAAGLGFGWSLSGVIQSLSVEVYTLNVALVLAALALVLIEGAGWRVAGPLFVLLALGLGNHHFLMVLAAPAISVAVWGLKGRPIPAIGAGGVLLIATTALIYAYLWVRGSAGAWPAWADTTSPDGVWWVASARLFSESLGGFDDPVSGVAKNLVKAFALLATDFSPAGVVLAAGGLYLCFRSGRLRTAMVLILLLAGSLASKVSMGILDPDNPDDHGYFLGAVASVAILQGLFGAGLAGLAAQGASLPATRWGMRTLGAAVLVATALVPPLFAGPTAVERLRLRDPVAVLRLIWEEQPPRSVLFLSHYPVFFQAMYGQAVEGTRPDVTLVQSSLYRKARGGRFYAERLQRGDPDLGALVQGFVDHGTLDAAEIRRLAAHRPVRFDAEDEPQMPRMRFAGWTLEAWTGTPDRGESPGETVIEAIEVHLARLRSLVPAWPEPMDLETRRVLLRHLASMARTLAGLGQGPSASRLLEAALELNPLDRQLRQMAKALQAPR